MAVVRGCGSRVCVCTGASVASERALLSLGPFSRARLISRLTLGLPARSRKVVLAGRGAGGRSGDCALREELLAFTGRRAVPVIFDVRGGRQELVGGMAELLTHLQRRQDLGGAPGAAGPTIGGVRL